MALLAALTPRELARLRKMTEAARDDVSAFWGGTATVYRLQDDLADLWWEIADEQRYRETHPRRGRRRGRHTRPGRSWS